MDDRIPPHHDNPETESTASFQVFDVEAVPLPPGTPASQRPANRPRQVVEGPVESFQSFEVEAVPLPPGTKATPRPAGRERPKPEDLDAQPEQIPVAPNYTALIQKNGAGWRGCVEQLAGVNAQGGTREELLVNLQAALREALEGK
jgi:hypothetical protein